MSRKGKLLTPRQYAEMNGVAYATVLYWLNTGRVEGAEKHDAPTGRYWVLPEDTPRPKKLSGRPRKEGAKKSKKGAAK